MTPEPAVTLATAIAGPALVDAIRRSRAIDGEPTDDGGWLLRYSAFTRRAGWVVLALSALLMIGPAVAHWTNPAITPWATVVFCELVFGALAALAVYWVVSARTTLRVDGGGIEVHRPVRGPIRFAWGDIEALAYSRALRAVTIQRRDGGAARVYVWCMDGMPRLRACLERHAPGPAASLVADRGFVAEVPSIDEAARAHARFGGTPAGVSAFLPVPAFIAALLLAGLAVDPLGWQPLEKWKPVVIGGILGLATAPLVARWRRRAVRYRPVAALLRSLHPVTVPPLGVALVAALNGLLDTSTPVHQRLEVLDVPDRAHVRVVSWRPGERSRDLRVLHRVATDPAVRKGAVVVVTVREGFF